MRPPLIISEGFDVHAYDSAEELELDTELPDVVDGIYECFDADALALRLVVEERSRIRLVEDVPRMYKRERLTLILKGSLASNRRAKGLTIPGGLEELIALVKQYQ